MTTTLCLAVIFRFFFSQSTVVSKSGINGQLIDVCQSNGSKIKMNLLIDSGFADSTNFSFRQNSRLRQCVLQKNYLHVNEFTVKF